MRALVIALLVLAPTWAEAGSKWKEKAKELKKASPEHHRWLTEDVIYIISDYERDAFLSLPDDAARDEFIKAFWQVRDPTPGTDRNEYQREHYKRFAEANALFGRTASRTGWKDERGKIYIQLGAPMHRENFTMHGRLYPLERWFYRSDPRLALPPFFNLIFYQPYGAGKFELYDPVIHGPEKLVGGILFGNDRTTPYSDRRFALEKIREVSYEVMQASMSLLPDDPPDYDRLAPSMTSRRLMARIEDFTNRQPHDERYVERLLSGAPDVEIEYSFRPMGMRAAFMGAFVPGAGTVLHYAIEIPPKSLTLQRYDDEISGALEIVGRLFKDGDTSAVTQIDEKVDIRFNLRELKRLRRNPLSFQDVVPLLPGRYRANLVVRNLVTREFGVVEGDFEVPARGDTLAVSTLMLSAQSRPAPDLKVRPFAIGARIYNPTHRVPKDAEVLTFFQVAYPRGLYEVGDNLIVNWSVTPPDADDALSSGSARLRLNPLFEDHLTIANIRVPLKEIEPGTYRLRMKLSDEDGRTVERSTPLTIYVGDPPAPPWVYANPRDYSAGELALAYADQYEARGEQEAALAALEQATGSPLTAGKARLRLGERRLRRKEFKQAVEALEPLLSRGSTTTYTLLLLGLARSGAGDGKGAIEAWENALRNSPRSTQVLNVLAEEWLRAGREDKALVLLKRSLEVDPEQPGPQALLTKARAKLPKEGED